MKVTEDLVRQVAALARLELTDDEVAEAVPKLQRIFEHVEQVQQVDVAGEDAATQDPVPIDRLRPDEPAPPLPRDQVLRNAPRQDGTFFVVPKFLED
jgi:aspartyl-tRNA(Asn)/glutamyl-tRNA(Gln) amidotransferase subunit C